MLPSLRGFAASGPFDEAFSHLLTDRHNFPDLVRCELACQSRFQFTLSVDSGKVNAVTVKLKLCNAIHILTCLALISPSHRCRHSCTRALRDRSI